MIELLKEFALCSRVPCYSLLETVDYMYVGLSKIKTCMTVDDCHGRHLLLVHIMLLVCDLELLHLRVGISLCDVMRVLFTNCMMLLIFCFCSMPDCKPTLLEHCCISFLSNFKLVCVTRGWTLGQGAI